MTTLHYQSTTPASPRAAANDFAYWAQVTAGEDRAHCLRMVRQLNIAVRVYKPRARHGQYAGVVYHADCTRRPHVACCAGRYLGAFESARWCVMTSKTVYSPEIKP